MALTVRFDATVDFATELRATLERAMGELSGDLEVIGVHLPSDDEQGELVAGNGEPTREVGEDDWYVVGCSVESVVSQLNALL